MLICDLFHLFNHFIAICYEPLSNSQVIKQEWAKEAWDVCRSKPHQEMSKNINFFVVLTCTWSTEMWWPHCVTDLDSPLLFHTYQYCVKPLAANCFHITGQPGDLGGFPRPPTLGHRACTFANAYHQSHSASIAGEHRPESKHVGSYLLCTQQ